jgi:hypothetical protein
MCRDVIEISTPLTLSSQVSGNGQFANDSLRTPFGDIQSASNIPQTNTRIPRYQQQRIPVICQQPKIGYWN